MCLATLPLFVSVFSTDLSFVEIGFILANFDINPAVAWVWKAKYEREAVSNEKLVRPSAGFELFGAAAAAAACACNQGMCDMVPIISTFYPHFSILTTFYLEMIFKEIKWGCDGSWRVSENWSDI